MSDITRYYTVPMTSLTTADLSHSAQLTFANKAALVGFFLIQVDILLNYFLRQAIGQTLPVTSLAALVLMILFLKSPDEVLPGKPLVFLLFLTVIMFILGHFTGNYHLVDASTLSLQGIALSITNSVAILLLGYYCFRWLPSNALIKVMLLAGVCHAVVCLVALFHLYPALFPMIIGEGRNDRGLPTFRPEVATDQNFQVFYFIPVAAILALPFTPLRTCLALFVSLAGAYTLAKLQTRSGVLVLFGCLAVSLAAPLWMRELGRKKVFLLACLAIAFVGLYHEAISNTGAALLERFSSKTGHETANARLEAIMFFVRNFWKPEFLVPQGPGRFPLGTAHSNVTEMMLRGGIIGVITWFVVYFFPTIKLAIRFLRRRLDAIGVVVLVISLSMLVTQLTLSLYAMKQIWLWAGAALGILAKLRSQEIGRYGLLRQAAHSQSN